MNTFSKRLDKFKSFYNNPNPFKNKADEFTFMLSGITLIIVIFGIIIYFFIKEYIIKGIFEYDFSQNTRLEKVRDLFVFGCFTGMRFSNYSIIKKNDIYNGFINVRDVKDNSKSLSIPLNDYSSYILKKYDFKLPVITNQKFNDYIKEVVQAVGLTDDIKKTMKLGQEIIETISPLYERVSSHTARRSFITIMKNKKIPDKVIMGYTGHKSLEVFNQYYKPNMDEKIDFMQTVWKMDNTPLKKVD
ncbi:hypothetical protein KU06062659_950002 [Flavobacterium psychrophilum]|uniref:tyrosine-type recombinase/integrase n=1 Tax=Flavobacterium psychrophilum TaxID=96345 RepID=UPI000B7C480D|nr:tyrosine-type recombinase/integrase [Flavobacterium psychrophilum]GEJ39389.1 hypothetical protein FPN184_contig00102-0002 [Flavobacterium psychrophilum]GEJ50413.1 hypothetical protein FPKKA176_contig00101-0005 [Flavobacterium psychrophilum]SNB23107.1 hypothetical protein KU06062659_950002 [Flavobacterium psychrophilum]